MQDLNFGRFIGLVVRDGEPVCDPLPQRIRVHKFCSENGPRQERDAVDFILKSEIIELFAYFEQVRNGTIDMLEIKYGLPFSMNITEVSA